MRTRRVGLLCVGMALGLAGCPSSGTPTGTPSVAPITRPKASPSVKVSTPPATVSVTGVLTGPSASLIANNAGSIIGNHGTNLIANGEAARLRSRDNSAGWRVLQAGSLAPVEGASVQVYTPGGTALLERGVPTGADGRFTLPGIAAAEPFLLVKATYSLSGQPITLAGLVGSEGGEIQVNPASTVVAKKIEAAIAASRLSPGAVNVQEAIAFAARLTSAMNDRAIAAAALLEPRLVAETYDGMLKESPTLAVAAPRQIPATPASSAPSASPSARPSASPSASPSVSPSVSPTPKPNGGVVDTIAGDGTPGLVNGPGASARFKQPEELLLADDGVLYLVGNEDHTVRTITFNATGQATVATLAGSGNQGLEDGTGNAAAFRFPRGLAMDPGGFLYVTDNGNNRIRIISATGAVTTLERPEGGVLSISNTEGLAADEAGVLHVQEGNRIVRVQNGTMQLFAGDNASGYMEGAGGVARFNGPEGLAFGPDGTLYVADRYNHCIRQITTSGTVSTLAGTNQPGFADGPANAARFKEPCALAVRGEWLVVADSGNHAIRRIKLGANVSVETLAGNGTAGFADATGTSARFNFPEGVAIAPDGTIYVSDLNNHRLRRIR